MAQQKSEGRVMRAGPARVPSWWKSSRTDPKRGLKPIGGGNASPGAGGRRSEVIQRNRCAGQGAHREVGSEGFAANRRAVAEIGEPVGQIQVMPSLHYGGRKYLGRLDATRCLRAARWERSMRYPGRSRTVPLDGVGYLGV